MTKNRKVPSSSKGARTRADPRPITDIEQKIIWLSYIQSEGCSRRPSLRVTQVRKEALRSRAFSDLGIAPTQNYTKQEVRISVVDSGQQ